MNFIYFIFVLDDFDDIVDVLGRPLYLEYFSSDGTALHKALLKTKHNNRLLDIGYSGLSGSSDNLFLKISKNFVKVLRSLSLRFLVAEK
ncbi:hypothetical protein DERP_002436 [Dermatophagoides pteronyssinus]|uniref:Uncharacterized protein n=1 Tax=Dermatophagoides pteronyssinus TaxID=6956 RepID=A0ABQ8JIH7_DERPT|nr:hypothetical protein DERP_002436 [Dermatophagoides pteronyssinus]